MPEKILIVEDNPQSMAVALMVLRPHGYTLFEATDGEEALKVAVGERPDLIIMDIQLPGISGLEVARRLRHMPDFSHIPIIALTAYAMRGDEEKVIEAGFNAYLSKPINTRELPKVVTEMLLRRKQDNSCYQRRGNGEENPCG